MSIEVVSPWARARRLADKSKAPTKRAPGTIEHPVPGVSTGSARAFRIAGNARKVSLFVTTSTFVYLDDPRAESWGSPEPSWAMRRRFIGLVLRSSLEFGLSKLAVLALATVHAAKTVASAMWLIEERCTRRL
ncbi:MAG: hypothetical protein GXP26_06055 [Planctomycetes bacterium]|nr:hypothetical protein [Planctomycetota bacterium]